MLEEFSVYRNVNMIFDNEHNAVLTYIEMCLYLVLCIVQNTKCINDQLFFRYTSTVIACLHVSIILTYVDAFIITPTWFCMQPVKSDHLSWATAFGGLERRLPKTGFTVFVHSLSSYLIWTNCTSYGVRLVYWREIVPWINSRRHWTATGRVSHVSSFAATPHRRILRNAKRIACSTVHWRVTCRLLN